MAEIHTLFPLQTIYQVTADEIGSEDTFFDPIDKEEISRLQLSEHGLQLYTEIDSWNENQAAERSVFVGQLEGITNQEGTWIIDMESTRLVNLANRSFYVVSYLEELDIPELVTCYSGWHFHAEFLRHAFSAYLMPLRVRCCGNYSRLAAVESHRDPDYEFTAKQLTKFCDIFDFFVAVAWNLIEESMPLLPVLTSVVMEFIFYDPLPSDGQKLTNQIRAELTAMKDPPVKKQTRSGRCRGNQKRTLVRLLENCLPRKRAGFA